MKNWSVKFMLIFGSSVSVLLMILMGAGQFWTTSMLNKTLEDTLESMQLVQNQMDADMVHDTMRSDIFGFRLASEQGDAVRQKELMTEFEEHTARFLKNMAENAELAKDSKIQQKISVIIPLVQQYGDLGQVVLKSPDVPTQDQHIPAFQASFKQLEAAMGGLSDELVNQAADRKAKSDAQVKNSQLMLVTMLSIAIVMIAGCGWLVYRAVSVPLQNMVNTLQHIERSGDLTVRVAVDGNNEVAWAMKSFNALMNSLQTIVRDVRASSVSLLDNSRSMTGIAERVLQASQRSSDETSSVAAAMEELSASIEHISIHAGAADENSCESASLSKVGFTDMGKAEVEMNQIAETVKSSAQLMQNLQREVEAISQVTNVIRSIADQTNLLALNAAIEAARAGEEGRGFAVVADEVRSLAERTAESTEKITSTVESIQAGTKTAVDSMSQGVVRVETGVQLTQEAAQTVSQAADKANQVASIITQISGSLSEQKTVGQDINRSIEQVARISEESYAMARDTSKRAAELSDLAQRLQQQIERFSA